MTYFKAIIMSENKYLSIIILVIKENEEKMKKKKGVESGYLSSGLPNVTHYFSATS